MSESSSRDIFDDPEVMSIFRQLADSGITPEQAEQEMRRLVRVEVETGTDPDDADPEEESEGDTLPGEQLAEAYEGLGPQ